VQLGGRPASRPWRPGSRWPGAPGGRSKRSSTADRAEQALALDQAREAQAHVLDDHPAEVAARRLMRSAEASVTSVQVERAG
jgi:hypothetical protein